MLDELEARAAGQPLTPEAVIEAVIVPALQVSRDPLKGGAAFLRLLGRALSEPADYMRVYLPRHYRDEVLRFKDALVRALPGIPEVELVWRMHFTFGAMSYALAGNDALQLMATCDAEGADDAEAIVRRLVPFLAAGLRAPLPSAAAAARPTRRDSGRKAA
jgi:hypothetical protein